MRTLVAYDSHGVSTRTIASAIAITLGADVDLILARQSREGVVGWLRSAYDTTFERAIEIANPARQVDDYDVVIIGSATCHGGIPGAVRTYVERYAKRFRRVALFATSGGGGGQRGVEHMARLCGHGDVPRLVLLDGEVRSGRADAAVVAFARSVVLHASPQDHAA